MNDVVKNAKTLLDKHKGDMVDSYNIQKTVNKDDASGSDKFDAAISVGAVTASVMTTLSEVKKLENHIAPFMKGGAIGLSMGVIGASPFAMVENLSEGNYIQASENVLAMMISTLNIIELAPLPTKLPVTAVNRTLGLLSMSLASISDEKKDSMNNQIQQGMDSIVDKVNDIVDNLQDIGQQMLDNMNSSIDSFIDNIKDILDTVSDLYNNIVDNIKSVIDDIKDIFSDIQQSIKDVFDNIRDSWNEIKETLKQNLKDWWENFKDDISNKWLDWVENPDGWINNPFKKIRDYYIVDPVVLDLDGDGIETLAHAKNKGAMFDFDGDGLKNATGWVKSDDGILVFDRNGDGLINDGREIFGDSTVKSDGTTAKHGFDALADLDTNKDGKITAEDVDFAKLKVWQDKNQDGISQADELKTLAEHGITALNLNYQDTNETLAGDNQLAQRSSYEKADGSTFTMGDVNFRFDTFYSEYIEKTPVSDDIKALPNLAGFGRVMTQNDEMWQVVA